MIRKKRTEVTIETQELFAVKRINSSVQAWCKVCAGSGTMISAEQAAVLAGVSHRSLYRMVEADQVHFRETPDGVLLVCPRSLLKALNDASLGNEEL